MAPGLQSIDPPILIASKGMYRPALLQAWGFVKRTVRAASYMQTIELAAVQARNAASLSALSEEQGTWQTLNCEMVVNFRPCSLSCAPPVHQ